MRNSTTGALIKPPGKPSPSELAKEDVKEYVRQNGPTSLLERDPRCIEYLDAVADLIKQGRADMSVRQMTENLRKHFGYAGKLNPVHLYIQNRYGGMRRLRGQA